MASVVILTTILIVVSTLVKSQQTLLHNHLKKSVPLHFWEHDKEKLNRYVEQDARGPQVRVGPRLAPLFTQQTLDQWQGAGRAVHTDEGIKKVRVNLLKSKLMPQASQQRKIVAHRKVFPKPETNQYQRHKRDVDQTKGTKIKEEVEAVRKKRQVMLNALPEMVMQPHIQPALPQDKETKYQEKVKEKRDKRQIIYLINRQPLLFANKPKRTTPNPFNREADIADYEIVRPTPEGIIPAPVETDEGIDTGSYLLSETSELEYESDYTISMSDVEDWENYPLTTPSGPNPGWRLSTLADIYQRPRRNRMPIRVEQVQVFTRMKRSPKEKKRKIGLYKERLKQRRKRKEMRRKRRIITKEDKIRMKAEESIKKDEEVVENLLQKPRIRQRKTTYGENMVSREVLWLNDTHRIVEDPGATMKWINKTHYQIFKENATDEWYNEDHILMYGEEYLKNKTAQGKESEPEEQDNEEDSEEDEGDEEYVEDYDEEFTREEEEEKEFRTKKGKHTNDQDSNKNKKPKIEKGEEEVKETFQTDDIEEEQKEKKLREKTTLKTESKNNEQKHQNSGKVVKDKKKAKTNTKKDKNAPNNKDINKKKSGDNSESSGDRKSGVLGWEDQIDRGSDEEKLVMESLGILSDEAILESDSSEDLKKKPKKKSGKKGKQKMPKNKA